MSSEKKIVLSGMRSTGKLHLGHLFGTLNNWVDLQATHACYFFAADWHALTSEYADPSRITENTVDMVADWIAAGTDPERSVVDRNGESHEVRRLFVGDGSLVPRTLSVNPSLTIMALATRLAEHLDADPSGYLDARAAQVA